MNEFCLLMSGTGPAFTDVLTTFLSLDGVSSLAVYGGSESSRSSSEIS